MKILLFSLTSKGKHTWIAYYHKKQTSLKENGTSKVLRTQ